MNLPIIPGKLAVRLAGIAEDDDLDGVKSVNSSASPYYHTYAGRASVRFEPIDAIEANVMYQHLFWHQTQFPQVAGPGAPGGVDPNAPANYNGPADHPDPEARGANLPDPTYNHEDLLTGQLDWHFLGQLSSYNGSYWNYAGQQRLAPQAANQVPGINAANRDSQSTLSSSITPSTTQRTQTDELRLASETPIFGFMDYTVGGFFRHTSDPGETSCSSPASCPALLDRRLACSESVHLQLRSTRCSC